MVPIKKKTINLEFVCFSVSMSVKILFKGS
jgi:hypothetical protein